MHRRGGPNVAIAFGPGRPLTAQLRAVESPGGPVSGADRRKRDSTHSTSSFSRRSSFFRASLSKASILSIRLLAVFASMSLRFTLPVVANSTAMPQRLGRSGGR